jgi:hypothetical protein
MEDVETVIGKHQWMAPSGRIFSERVQQAVFGFKRRGRVGHDGAHEKTEL